jgi:hypothetical protein
MRIGVVFPQTEIGPDAGAVRAYGQGVEDLGFAHLLAYDHVVGVDRTVHVGWNGPSDLNSTFHEPLVTFGYLAYCGQYHQVTGAGLAPLPIQRPIPGVDRGILTPCVPACGATRRRLVSHGRPACGLTRRSGWYGKQPPWALV